MNTPEQPHWRHSDVFIATFEQISHIVVFSIVDFEQVNKGWVIRYSTIIIDIYQLKWVATLRNFFILLVSFENYLLLFI